MGYKQPSSGLPFKQMGSSPAKQTETGSDKQMREITERNTAKSKSKSSWDIGGYLKGEQGYIPDYKGESTKKTVNKVARKVVKATDDKPKAKESLAKGASEAASEVVTQGGKMGLKDSMKKMNKTVTLDKQINPHKPVEKKYTKVRSDLKMKPPYKKPVGPRAN